MKYITSLKNDSQKGNYRVTIQKNTDAQDRLDWKPLDRLKKYITKYIVI